MTAETVKPAFVVPIPDVKTDLAETLVEYFKNCDLAVPRISHAVNRHNQEQRYRYNKT